MSVRFKAMLIGNRSGLWKAGSYAKKKGRWPKYQLPVDFMVRLEGFEPPAYGLEVRCSIQLSYRRLQNKPLISTSNGCCP